VRQTAGQHPNPPPTAFTSADVDNLRAVTYGAGQLLTPPVFGDLAHYAVAWPCPRFPGICSGNRGMITLSVKAGTLKSSGQVMGAR
jgi:hypothetical protein